MVAQSDSLETDLYNRDVVDRRLGWSLLASVVVLAATVAQTSHARRDPYFVLQSSDPAVRPHILFVLDTSGSMAWQTQSTETQCEWPTCEDIGGVTESRISTARRVINQVALATQTQASFALMTFDQHDAPRQATEVPPPCSGSGGRFAWTTHYGYFDWTEIDKYPSVQGAWRLCQGNEQRPWPYLRWDELGVGAPTVTQQESGAIPPSPMIGTAAGQVDDASNANRRVQWFPHFAGVRFHPIDVNDEMVAFSFGDYAVDQASRSTEVVGHDFYYWPYVDGFPHYADTSTFPFDTGLNRAGVFGQNDATSEGKLYAPFFLDLADNPEVLPAHYGPTSEAAAVDKLDRLTRPLVEGGLDVSGGTPWLSVIGDPDPVTGDVFRPTNVAGDAVLSVGDPAPNNTVVSYLRFVDSVNDDGFCAPTSVVIVSDGIPSPGQGGQPLFERLSELRRETGTRIHVVGFFSGGASETNDMACAATGSCSGVDCANPCTAVSSGGTADTCADPLDPLNSCAYQANSGASLASALTAIVQQELSLDLTSGPTYTLNEFDVPPAGGVTQTTIRAYTDFPGWAGHVVRDYCDYRDTGGALLDLCTPPVNPGVPFPEFELDAIEEGFGPCLPSRSWDAGVCLQQTVWSDRRVYSVLPDGTPYRISDPTGQATAQFQAELSSLGLLTGPNPGLQANEIVAFILGRDWPDGWKLPGVSNSAPTVAARIPEHVPAQRPSIAIRDPHCAGRSYEANGDLPASLIAFSETSRDPANRINTPSPHYEYQSAVLVGDDLGILHAFQLDSGNELWGFLPRELFSSMMDQFAVGAPTRGQPPLLADHSFGISATVNAGWIYDQSDPDPANHVWRHLGVFGLGQGGRDFYALDLSHMSPVSPRGPFDLLWTTATDPVNTALDAETWIGETWARPALTYDVPGDLPTAEPNAFVVLTSGYPDTDTRQGRRIYRLNAATGELQDEAEFPVPTGPTVQPLGDYAALVDPSVTSECRSGFWAEAQETYIADPAGRLFRWDLGADSAHAADSGAPWSTSGIAQPLFTAPACLGAGDTCTVSAANPGDPFLFAPGITMNNRIVDLAGNPDPVDEFLIALISGSHDDAALDPTGPGSNYHSSIYLLVDDHIAPGDRRAGLSIPTGMPKFSLAQIGSDAGYLRLALSDIPRTRTVVPYAGAPSFTETRNFAAATRPARAPVIRVSGLTRDVGGNIEVIDGTEVFDVVYTVYEPPRDECDDRFFDESTNTWHPDRGDTFLIVLRLTASSTGGFDFITGTTDAAIDLTGIGQQNGLQLLSVTQVERPGCQGNCGADASGGPPPPACDNNPAAGPAPNFTAGSVTLSRRQVAGFDPIE